MDSFDGISRKAFAQKNFYGVFRLCNKHFQPARAGNLPAFRVQNKLCAQRIVNDVDNALQTGKPFKQYGRFFCVGKHADRRGIDDNLRIAVHFVTRFVGNGIDGRFVIDR